jgi:hypothetical protein
LTFTELNGVEVQQTKPSRISATRTSIAAWHNNNAEEYNKTINIIIIHGCDTNGQTNRIKQYVRRLTVKRLVNKGLG